MARVCLFLFILSLFNFSHAEYLIRRVQVGTQYTTRVEVGLIKDFKRDDAIVPNSERVEGEEAGAHVSVERPYFNHPEMAARYAEGGRSYLEQNVGKIDGLDSAEPSAINQYFIENYDFGRWFVNSDGSIKRFRQLSWKNHGFTVKTHKANPEDPEYNSEEKENLEGLRTWMVEVMGAQFVEDLVSSLSDYKRVDVRHLSFDPESLIAAADAQMIGQPLKACVSVFWQARLSGHHDFCGTMTFQVEGSELVTVFNFENWFDDSAFSDREDAKVLFPAVEAALLTTYHDRNHVLELLQNLVAAAAKLK